MKVLNWRNWVCKWKWENDRRQHNHDAMLKCIAIRRWLGSITTWTWKMRKVQFRMKWKFMMKSPAQRALTCFFIYSRLTNPSASFNLMGIFINFHLCYIICIWWDFTSIAIDITKVRKILNLYKLLIN